MFGESDSESPRVPSPWDSLTSSSPSPPSRCNRNRVHGVPKLVPEAEEGNVEYKLQLLSPSPARFARLVTQLKWRLLEGGGQAYYELGVADSGTLVGLPRQRLEESLETLEMMAGEIGASVIVVKEIEVPPELSSLAESQLERWGDRKSPGRKGLSRTMKHDASPTTSTTEFETELSNTDVMDTEESSGYSSITSSDLLEEAETQPAQLRPSATSLPFDPSLATFSTDVGEDVANYADSEEADGDVAAECASEFSVSLEVCSVYKPRPMKKRAIHTTSPPSTLIANARTEHENDHLPSKSTDTTCHTGGSAVQHFETLSRSNGVKIQSRRDKRGKRRETKLNIFPTPVSTGCFNNPPTPGFHTIPLTSSDATETFALEPRITVVDLPTGDASSVTTAASKEPRLIIEALVFRKLSSDEAFLDFGGFSLL